ncbi:MAG: hypothetical protein K0V04_33490 [Deltaproteobacteria bacterium]|nr:hypothetical protein [Deltaproteobacteria bacterium]
MLSQEVAATTPRTSTPCTPYTAERELETHLRQASLDHRHRDWLFGALLAGKVYVVDYEIGLGDRGPFVELRTMKDSNGPVLAVYTSLARIPMHVDPRDAQAMPFPYVLRALSTDASITVRGPTSFRIGPSDLALLRRIATE